MTYREQLKKGFEDELEKISGELQGFTRIGRKPIGVDRLLEREAESEVTPTDVAMGPTPPNEKVKLSDDMKKRLGSVAATMGAGALGYHVIRKANQDRQLGRQVRMQQGQ